MPSASRRGKFRAKSDGLEGKCRVFLFETFRTEILGISRRIRPTEFSEKPKKLFETLFSDFF